MFFIFIMVACFIGMAYCLLMLGRNAEVARYRQALLTKVSDAARVDIAEGRDWQWRYDMYNEVSYHDQVRQFWKPLDDFYTDKSFMRGGK